MKIVAEYYPDAELQRRELASIFKSRFTYQVTILAGKFADKHEEVATIVKNDFLTRYFGPDVSQNFVLTLLKEGLRKDALEVNRAIKTLGFESSDLILRQLKRNT